MLDIRFIRENTELRFAPMRDSPKSGYSQKSSWSVLYSPKENTVQPHQLVAARLHDLGRQGRGSFGQRERSDSNPLKHIGRRRGWRTALDRLVTDAEPERSAAAG